MNFTIDYDWPSSCSYMVHKVEYILQCYEQIAFSLSVRGREYLMKFAYKLSVVQEPLN